MSCRQNSTNKVSRKHSNTAKEETLWISLVCIEVREEEGRRTLTREKSFIKTLQPWERRVELLISEMMCNNCQTEDFPASLLEYGLHSYFSCSVLYLYVVAPKHSELSSSAIFLCNAFILTASLHGLCAVLWGQGHFSKLMLQRQ